MVVGFAIVVEVGSVAIKFGSLLFKTGELDPTASVAATRRAKVVFNIFNSKILIINYKVILFWTDYKHKKR